MTHANDQQIAGTHYKSTIQHWDHAVYVFGTGYLRGQITKYVYRWRKKNGLQDLYKARHFLEKLIEVEHRVPIATTEVFLAANSIGVQEAEIIRCISAHGRSLCALSEKLATLHKAAELLDELIAAEPSSAYTDQS